MVSIIEAIFLGVIQGITEWLPVSSSGHLVLAQHYLGVTESIELDAFLHVATVLVVVAYFRNEVTAILKEINKAAKKAVAGKKPEKTKNLALAYLILVACIPTGLIGLGFKDFLEDLYTNAAAVSLALIVTGVFLLASKREKKPIQLDWGAALIIGLAQGLAIVPGISRSGATIAAALFLGVRRKEAAKFSFLILLPAAFGGLLLEGGAIAAGVATSPIQFMAGFTASLLVGYASLNYLMKIIKQGRFHIFAYYVIPLGIITLLI